MKTFPLESQVDSLADLGDGFVLSQMLGTCRSSRPFVLLPPVFVSNANQILPEDFDSAFAIHDLERNASPSKWPAKKKSLEAVYRALLRFIATDCGTLNSHNLPTDIDFNAIAEHNDTSHMIKVGVDYLASIGSAD